MRGPLSRSRPSFRLPVGDGALVGALGLQRELALGLTHRLLVLQTPRPPCSLGAPAASSSRRIFFCVSDGCAKA